MKVVYWWSLFIDESCFFDESCRLMKVVYWWELSIDESYLLMNVVYWWKLSSDGSCLLMKVIIVKEVISCDVSPVAMFYKVMNVFWKVCFWSFRCVLNTSGKKYANFHIFRWFWGFCMCANMLIDNVKTSVFFINFINYLPLSVFLK